LKKDFFSADNFGSPLVYMQNVGKDFPVATTGLRHLKTIWSLLTGRGEYQRFSALRGVNLKIHAGQSLGLIGENGAGKTTLLKIIAGVIKPSTGKMEINCRVGALLELGAGFHPEYTGRENIFLTAALMGMSKSDIAENIDSIINFADIGEHIDKQIKHYSSGMFIRLGFAVVTALRPDLLITDEILAVGDEAFQKKCIKWMESYLSDGGTLMLCSHSMYHINKICGKALWLHMGQPRLYGDSIDVTREYLAHFEEKNYKAEHFDAVKETPEKKDNEKYAIRELWLEDQNNNHTSSVTTGEDMYVCGTVYSPDRRIPVVVVGILRADGTPVYAVSTENDRFRPDELGPNLFGFTLNFKQIPLLPGKYIIRAHAMDPEGMRLFDPMEYPFDILGQTREIGLCYIEHEWFPGKSGGR
jgi:lipopolysaccharide transport system ATP-binding protein